MFDSGPCDWLVLPFLLPTPTTVVNGIGRNENVLILPTLFPLRL